MKARTLSRFATSTTPESNLLCPYVFKEERAEVRAPWLMSPRHTEAPREARIRAVANPIPDPAPVGAITLPVNEAITVARGLTVNES